MEQLAVLFTILPDNRLTMLRGSAKKLQYIQCGVLQLSRNTFQVWESLKWITVNGMHLTYITEKCPMYILDIKRLL